MNRHKGAAVLIAAVGLVLGLRSMLENGVAVEQAPALFRSPAAGLIGMQPGFPVFTGFAHLKYRGQICPGKGHTVLTPEKHLVSQHTVQQNLFISFQL